MEPPFPNPITWTWTPQGGQPTPVTVSTEPLPGESQARTDERHTEAVQFWMAECPPDPD